MCRARPAGSQPRSSCSGASEPSLPRASRSGLCSRAVGTRTRTGSRRFSGCGATPFPHPCSCSRWSRPDAPHCKPPSVRGRCGPSATCPPARRWWSDSPGRASISPRLTDRSPPRPAQRRTWASGRSRSRAGAGLPTRRRRRSRPWSPRPCCAGSPRISRVAPSSAHARPQAPAMASARARALRGALPSALLLMMIQAGRSAARAARTTSAMPSRLATSGARVRLKGAKAAFASR